MFNGDDSIRYAHPQSAGLDENDEHTRTAYQDEGVYRRSERTTTKNKRIISRRPNRRVLTGAYERNQTKNKNYVFSPRTVAQERALRTVEQTDLRLLGGGSNAIVGLCATRRAHAVIQH